ncbi:MAG: flagellar hook capping protein [Ignavibacteriae bacterium]|nr:flagellar hook capping protein [Ignavibacteriota bacterium]MCB0750153.1 flagellar hook capping protein [Ignavibacteriota bacterium]MCB9206118.1 flagellar hook capping protein [Ignavibacteriales bacterium]MCB9209391.1 flagellar hook capping protein [Ignavibacteriales bacterium]MCB9258034.1 flagellar hook capping protein [Ignavibacteriales bacterium]
MLDSVSSTSSSSNVQYATQSNDAMDKDAFLKLMIAQLQNQDPLEPLDGTDYSAQLAQFSSLEQLSNINDSLNMSLDANYLLTQSINNTMTAGLIGKEVKIAGDTVAYKGQESTTIGYELTAPAQEMTIKIKDSNGAVVKTFDDVDLELGAHKLSWDFTDNNGNKVSAGDYTVVIEAKNLSLTDMEVAQYFVGAIDGVRFSSNGTTILVNGLEYQISEIFEVINSEDDIETVTDTDETEDLVSEETTEDYVDINDIKDGKIKDKIKSNLGYR